MIHTPLIIIGAKGMLGQDLAREFAEYEPLLWDREEIDITDAAMVMQKLEEVQPGTVINAAAYNAVDDAEEEAGFAAAMAVNANGPENLAKVCNAVGATFLTYTSDYVFEGIKEDGYTEDDDAHPVSNYGKSKRAGEERVLAIGGNGFIVRTCKLFGHPGASEQSKQSFVDIMLKLSEDRDTLEVVDEELASPTFTPDLAKQTRVLLEGAHEGTYAPGIYHITNSGGCTWYTFAQEIFRIAGKEMTLTPVTADAFPRPAARPKYSILLNRKLPEMRPWQEALADYLSQR